MEVGLLAREWKAQYAVRDETSLVQKLCETLENILGDTLTKWLGQRSAPHLQFRMGEVEG